MQNRNYSATIKHCIINERTIQNTKYTQQCNHKCLIQTIGISLEKQNRNNNAIKQVNCIKTTGELSCISYKATRQSRTVYTPNKNLKESKIFSIKSVSNKFLCGVRVTRSLVLYVCFVDGCLSFCTLSFGHCVVCSSSIYGF